MEDDNLCDTIMGLDSILHSGGNDALKDFMLHTNTERIIQKLLEYLMQNVRLLVVMDPITSDDCFHQTYPAISMVISILDNNSPQTAEILQRKMFIEILQEGFMVLLKVRPNHYWDEIFKNWL